MALAEGVGVVVAAVLAFLLRLGSDGQKPAFPSGPTFDETVVPLITDADRLSLANYPARPDAKAVAISRGRLSIVDEAAIIEVGACRNLSRSKTYH
jgi:hypothetical protein